MKLNKTNALLLWEERYGNRQFAEDFDGALMCRDAYGDPDYFVCRIKRKQWKDIQLKFYYNIKPHLTFH